MVLVYQGRSFAYINLREVSLVYLLHGSSFDIGFISQGPDAIVYCIGDGRLLFSDFQSPLTAIILVTEMVGSLNQLMVIGLVALSSYVIMDILGWRACLRSDVGKILPEEVEQQEHMTLIEVVVNETLDQTFVSELRLPDSCLITNQIHHGKSRIVKGNSQLFMGDSLLIAVQFHKFTLFVRYSKVLR